jgi:hypothetical protein
VVIGKISYQATNMGWTQRNSGTLRRFWTAYIHSDSSSIVLEQRKNRFFFTFFAVFC